MSIVKVRKLCRLVEPYQTVTLSRGSIYASTISVPPETTWLRTYNTYCPSIVHDNTTKLMYKNMGMLLNRLNYKGDTNAIRRYRKVRIFF